jgi:hypothetical protein
MKKEEVPQDDANMLEGKTRELQYAVDENGNYVKVKSVGWETKNIILQSAWDEVTENTLNALKEVEQGKKSPIYFFMHKNIMDVKILSEYTGIWVFCIKRHFKPKVFKKLSDKKLEKYIKAFKLNSISELKLFNIDKYKQEIIKNNKPGI